MLLTDIISKSCVLTQDELIADVTLLRDIQTRLVAWGMYPEKKVDGLWGRLTEGAIINFCNRVHLNSYSKKMYGASFAQALLDKPSELITTAQATAIFGRMPTPEQMADLNRCLVRFEINTPVRLRHFTSQIAVESGNLKWMKELASGEAYEGRRDLGNTQPGWGKLYKGAGAIQLTGFYNYKAFSKFIGDPKVIELGCDYVARVFPFTSAAFFWHRSALNAKCDRGASVEQITRIVNGGQTGIVERKRYYAIACKVIS